MSTLEGVPIVEAADQQEWRSWLEQNHDSVLAIWLKFAKKGAPAPTVSYAEAVEEALCHGWIDGQVRRFDEHFYLQRFTPRRPRSKWSEINRQKATQLIADGRMTPAGRAQVDAAKADGRWDAAYPAQSKATVPADFQHALDQNADAKAFFDTLTGSSRYAFLHRLHHITDPQRRATRITSYIERLTAGRTLQD